MKNLKVMYLKINKMEKIKKIMLGEIFYKLVIALNYTFIGLNIVIGVKDGNVGAFCGWIIALVWFTSYLSVKKMYSRLLDDAMVGWKESNDLLSDIVERAKEANKQP